MTAQRPDRRSDFLVKAYGVYWSNIDRSYVGIWRTLGPITVVGTIVAAVEKGYLPLFCGTAFALLVLFWALNVMIDLNAWHRRNLTLLTAVEREFYGTDDHGRLMFKKYRRPSISWIEAYKINAIVFPTALLVVISWCVSYRRSCARALSSPEALILITSTCVATAATVAHFRARQRKAKEEKRELFPDAGPQNPKQLEKPGGVQT